MAASCPFYAFICRELFVFLFFTAFSCIGVARGHKMAETLNQTHRKLVKLITLGPQPCLTQ